MAARCDWCRKWKVHRMPRSWWQQRRDNAKCCKYQRRQLHLQWGISESMYKQQMYSVSNQHNNSIFESPRMHIDGNKNHLRFSSPAISAVQVKWYWNACRCLSGEFYFRSGCEKCPNNGICDGSRRVDCETNYYQAFDGFDGSIERMPSCQSCPSGGTCKGNKFIKKLPW